MTRVFLVRHGEAAAVWGEHADPGLSEHGRAQADAAAVALAARAPPPTLWTSPLARCRQTAAAIAARIGADPVVTPAIAEVPTPADVGDRRAWLAATFPTILGEGPAATRWADVGLGPWRDAVVAALARAPADGVVAVSHFIAINAVVSTALGREETIVCRPAPAAIVELAVDAGGRLRLVALGAQVGDPTVL